MCRARHRGREHVDGDERAEGAGQRDEADSSADHAGGVAGKGGGGPGEGGEVEGEDVEGCEEDLGGGVSDLGFLGRVGRGGGRTERVVAVVGEMGGCSGGGC